MLAANLCLNRSIAHGDDGDAQSNQDALPQCKSASPRCADPHDELHCQALVHRRPDREQGEPRLEVAPHTHGPRKLNALTAGPPSTEPRGRTQRTPAATSPNGLLLWHDQRSDQALAPSQPSYCVVCGIINKLKIRPNTLKRFEFLSTTAILLSSQLGAPVLVSCEPLLEPNPSSCRLWQGLRCPQSSPPGQSRPQVHCP